MFIEMGSLTSLILVKYARLPDSISRCRDYRQEPPTCLTF